MILTDADEDKVSYVVQRILIPIVYIIGLVGNSISIYVLTRKRMRCTTNIYLTALAVSDLVYLTTIFVRTFQHYKFTHIYTPIYFQLFGLSTWFVEACAFISMYIILSFTIERFIAIRYPLKRQTICTESMAKKVIAGVVIFSILATMVTFFEHKLGVEYRLLDGNGNPCARSFGAPDPTKHMKNLSGFQDPKQQSHNDDVTMATAEDTMQRLKRSMQAFQVEAPSIETSLIAFPATELPSYDVASEIDPQVPPPPIYWEHEHKQEMVALDLKLGHFNEDCKNVTYYVDASWMFENNVLYTVIWSYASLIFAVLLPLTLLATLNFFLILMVKRSNTLREKMTNANSLRKPKDNAGSSSAAQENRVTIILIAVVVCFLFFQIPWAVYCIVLLRATDLDPHLTIIIGNFFNFFGALNATTNFFLYCVLSDKYRKTVRELIIGKIGRRECSTTTASSGMNGNTRRSSYKSIAKATPSIK